MLPSHGYYLVEAPAGVNVKARIAGHRLSKDTFNEITELADDTFESSAPTASVAAVMAGSVPAQAGATPSSLDQTLPALQYSTVPEVNAIRTNRGGRGGRRNFRGRGFRGGGGRGASSSTGGQRHPGSKHPDLPAGEWTGCQMHFKHGKSAFFCSEPGTCPWKHVFLPRPTK